MAALSSAAAAAKTLVRPFYFRTDLRYIRIFYVVKYYILRISFLALRAPRGRKPYRLKAVNVLYIGLGIVYLEPTIRIQLKIILGIFT